MGLLVSATAEKKILIQGTTIELPNVYVRVEYSARANGTTLETAMATYSNHQAFKDGASVLLTDVPMSNIVSELTEGQTQDLSSSELYSKLNYEELGYLVEIV
jgi:hypothetical protein